MKFPRLVYKSADDHKLVDTEADFIEALADGFYASVPEAEICQHDAQYVADEKDDEFAELYLGEVEEEPELVVEPEPEVLPELIIDPDPAVRVYEPSPEVESFFKKK